MPPFGGPIPPTMMPAPPTAGPAVAPHGNQGDTAQAMGLIQTALKALQEALPSIPMGTELHTATIDAVKKIGAHMAEMHASPQMQMQNLLAMVQRAKAQQPSQMLAGMSGGQQPPAPPMMAPPPQSPPGMAAAA